MEHRADGPGGRLRHATLSVVVAALAGGAVAGAVLATHRTPAATAPGASPPARTAAAMAADPATGDVVLFGGLGASGPLHDTWLWNGSAWREAHPLHSPPPEYGAEMAWDPQSRRDILLGGTGGSTAACRSLPPPGAADGVPGLACPSLKEAWAWDGSDWAALSLGALAGHSLAGAEMATDPAQGRIVLLTADGAPPAGGASGGGTAVGGGIACPLIPASPAPSATPVACPPLPCRVEGAAGSASTSCQVCPPATGGALPSCSGCASCPSQPATLTWVFDGGAFREVPPRAAPSGGPPLGGRLVWFPAIGRLADLTWGPVPMMGGAVRAEIACIEGQPCPRLTTQVWEWDGARWSAHPLARGAVTLPTLTGVAPDATRGDAVALDAAGATWVSADPVEGWTRVSAAPGAGARSGEAIADAGGSGAVVLFGGARPGGAAGDDTWTWDGSRWSHRAGAAPPPPPGTGSTTPAGGGTPALPPIEITSTAAPAASLPPG